MSELFQGKLLRLGIVAFTAGAVVMALEIVSSRILTPVFGSSTYTWGSLIGVVLTGLSLGYFLGGKIADKNPSFEKINTIVFLAGLYIVLVPFIATGFIGLATSILPANQYTALFTTFTLLMFPTTLLGFVSPYMIKLGTHTLTKVGNISGNLYAIATVGSIVGTFLTIFVLLPSFEVQEIIFSLGIALMASSLVGLGKFHKIMIVVVAVILLVPLSALDTTQISYDGTIILEKETQYSNLVVVDSGTKRTLYLNGMLHSQMDLDNPAELVVRYTKFFHLGGAFNADIDRVLFLGGGGFSGPKNFLATYPDAIIDVVEIDSQVIQVAKQYFELQEDSRLHIFNEDARTFLSQNKNRYDLIILDVYARDYVPFHLLTKEFFELANSNLEYDGILISNIIGSLTGNASDMPRAAYKTMGQVFPTVYAFTIFADRPGIVQNIMFVATKNPHVLESDDLSSMALENNATEILQGTDFVENFHDEKINIEDVPILTDSLSSIDLLINPITSQPYVIEDNLFPKIDSKNWFTNSTLVKILLLLVLVFFCIVYICKIWKETSS